MPFSRIPPLGWVVIIAIVSAAVVLGLITYMIFEFVRCLVKIISVFM